MTPYNGSTDKGYKGAGDYGFFTAIYECYNNHWALKTIPDDWWYTIIRTIAMAIDNNSKNDEVRKFFVDHDDKKTLTVDVDSTLQDVDYENFFHQMSNLIQSNIKVNGYVDTVRSDFSTSTPTHRIISEITVMSSMQEFFDYCMRTLCGIPYLVVLGNEEDWIQLKTKFLKLKEILSPINDLLGINFSTFAMPGTSWWDRVEIICDKLIETANGNADQQWWSQIFTSTYHKANRTWGSGSYPAHTKYDGWFLRDLLNISRIESFKSLPSGLVSVPLIFNNIGVITKGGIVSRIAGIEIDNTKDIPVVESIHGWAIFH